MDFSFGHNKTSLSIIKQEPVILFVLILILIKQLLKNNCTFFVGLLSSNVNFLILFPQGRLQCQAYLAFVHVFFPIKNLKEWRL